MQSASASFIYNDLSGLNSIKQQSRTDEAAALMTVAQQFESMLIEQMLKSSRAASDLINPDGFMKSHAHDTWREMHDQQLALTLSSQGGLGLADQLIDQWRSQLSPSGNSLPSQIQPLADMTRAQVLRPPAITLAKPAAMAPLPASVEPIEPIEPPMSLTQAAPDSVDHLPTQVVDFVGRVWQQAKQTAEQLGLDARYLVAQAALETGWGQHMIQTSEGGNSHNLFGIKAHRDWQGPQAEVMTHEYRHGVRLQQQDRFRVYDDYQHSFADYVAFLQSNPRYEQALASTHNGKQYVQALQQAGYATDPKYADKIHRLAQGASLNQAIAWFEEAGHVAS